MANVTANSAFDMSVVRRYALTDENSFMPGGPNHVYFDTGGVLLDVGASYYSDTLFAFIVYPNTVTHIDAYPNFGSGISGDPLYSVSGIDLDWTVPFPGYPFFTGRLTVNFAALLTGNDAISGSSQADKLLGYAGADSINGGSGNDTIDGGAGPDSVSAGAGFDQITMLVTAGDIDAIDAGEFDSDTLLLNGTVAGDHVVVVDLSSTTDQVASIGGVTDALIQINFENLNASGIGSSVNVIGSAAANAITGTSGNDTIDGGAGDDTLNGLAGNDTLNGMDGNDVLDGGLGADSMIGGPGDDIYTIDQPGDSLTELAEEGIDTVRINRTVDLNSPPFTEIENVALLGVAAFGVTGDAGDNAFIGNGAANALTGGDGDDTLLGGAGADNLQGGNGNDLFLLGSVVDFAASETINGGADDDTLLCTAAAGGTLTLTNKVTNIEHVALAAGTAVINVSAAALANSITLTGNDGRNVLTGTSQADTINGGGGDDIILIAHGDLSETEVIAGGDGNDTIRFTMAVMAGDGVLILTEEDTGIESVVIGTATGLTTGFLTLSIQAIEAPNALMISGNAGGNVLDGTAFNDTIAGNGGNDILRGGEGDDTLTGAAGRDTIDGGEGNDVVVLAAVSHFAAGEVINGGEGDDDVLRYTGGAAVLTLTANVSNIEKVEITNTTAAISVNASMVGGAGLEIVGNNGTNALTGTAGDDSLAGNGGNDVITGGAGADNISGGDGNDIIIVAAAEDVPDAEVINGGEGSDAIRFTKSIAGGEMTLLLDADVSGIDTVVIGNAAGSPVGTLALNVNASNVHDSLSLIGNAGVNELTGSDHNDTVVGNAGNDWLKGGDSDDTLVGGAGGDLLEGQGEDDVIVLASTTEYAVGEVIDGGSGFDRIRYTGAAALLNLRAEVTGIERVEIANLAGASTGTAVISVNASMVGGVGLEIAGNNGANTLTGTGQSDHLIGNGGNDRLLAGTGDDSLTGGAGADQLNGGGGTDLAIYTGSNAGVAVNLQTSIGAGGHAAGDRLTAIEDLLGSAFNDTLVGNTEANRLDGGAGIDSLRGGLGNDTYAVDQPGDVVTELPGEGTDTVNATVTWTLGMELENLTLAGSGDLGGFGNGLANVLHGNTGANFLSGGAGDDSLDGGSGADVLDGGSGDDVLTYDAGDQFINGGSGTDTLVATGSGATVDLSVTAQPGVDGIEVVDLTGSGDNAVLIDSAGLIAQNEAHVVRVTGNMGDAVFASGDSGNWVRGSDLEIGGDVYAVYTNGLAVLQVERELDRSGVAVGTSVFQLSALDGTNGFRLDGVPGFGAGAGGRSGAWVAAGGDVNHDGFDDFIIAAPEFTTAATAVGGGATYVVFGAASFGASVSLGALNGTNGFAAYGINTIDFSATSVAGAGDVDGDGFADILIGAPFAEPGENPLQPDQGEAYVVFGGESIGATLQLSALDGENGFQLNGVDEDDNAGSSVSSAGDINGDGYDDVLVGARLADPDGDSGAGETYLVFGGPRANFGASLDLASLDGDNGFRLDGIDASDYSGQRVAAAGDVNGDGFDDFLIGAPGADPGGDSGAGETYVVFGGASFDPSLDLSTLNGTNGFRVDGLDPGDSSGRVASADVNGDGYSDIVIGAPSADPGGRSSAGETYVIFGGASFGATVDLAALNGANGFRLDGINIGDSSGAPVASAGDVNGDGYEDILIAAVPADSGGEGEIGHTYVVFGGASFGASLDLGALDGTQGFRLEGIDTQDFSGRGISSAGDVNGDGFDDILVGADGADPGGLNSGGESYIVFGRDFRSEVDFLGTSGHDALTGTAGAENLVGGLGNDTISGLSGVDVLKGGGGDDVLVFDGADRLADGGNGEDTLRFAGSGQSLDLAGAGVAIYKYTDIEIVDLTGAGSNSLTLDLGDVLDLSQTTNTLRVDGNGGPGADSVTSTGQGWVAGPEQLVGYNTYTLGAATLLIDTDISQTIS